jgi:hypothetical protein
MSATLIPDAIPGEDLLGIEPELLQQVDPGWLHRLNLFAGRALTAPALQTEQLYRAGRLAVLGQCVTQGTVKGLELSADLSKTDPVLQVGPGYGISATGEDVTLLRMLSAKLSVLDVIDSQTGTVIAAFSDYKKNPANNNFAGVLLLQPITGQVSGSAVDTGALPVIVSGNLAASCDQDPEEFGFEDFQIVDGVRLVLVAWPATPDTLVLPSVTPAASWRNRLAYTIFNAEMMLAADDRLPWDLLGVPVGLIGFDSSWKALFVDRWSVVRTGGLRRSRYVLPAQPGAAAPMLVQPALAQARISQLSEQINTPPGLTNLIPACAFLPPCAILPASAMDFTHRIGLWFPPNWTLQVGPIHQEEIETVLLTGMTAQPLDVTQPEAIQVLVPLPDALYDRNILLIETVDPAFQQAVDSATQERAAVLQRRKAIQQEANALSQALTRTGQPPPYDLDAGLTPVEISDRDAQVYSPGPNETFGTTSFASSGSAGPVTYLSSDIQALLTAAQNPPFTILKDGNGNTLKNPLPLFSQDDLNHMAQNGLQHFIARINAKVSRANDLLDLAFLTAQSDIYRFRQFILGSTDATRLAVSPIVANIATGESAAATATNLHNYLSSLLPKTAAAAAAPASSALFQSAAVSRGLVVNLRPPSVTGSGTGLIAPSLTATGIGTSSAAGSSAAARGVGGIAGTGAGNVFTAGGVAGNLTASPGIGIKATALGASQLAGTQFTQINPGTVDQPATTGDVLGQSPLVGAQLNLRTITVAQRLANSPAQDGIFYAVGNRLAFVQLLADLEITIDDITILVDQWPPPPTTTGPPPTTTTLPFIPTILPTFADFRANSTVVLGAVEAPRLTLNSDEADMFSTGIHVIEQHTSLLRAIEARIAQYSDFVTQCSAALNNIQGDLPQAQSLLTQLGNDLAQARQNLAFTTALLNDEKQRVDNVNAQRSQTLANVPLVVYTRPRSLAADASVPSRQLVPGNIASPVPSCLQQAVAIPAELREIVSLLREAPVNWLPAVQGLLNQLERPILLQAVAVDSQVRAAAQLQLPLRASSAVSEPGVYAHVISGIYSANQQTFRAYQTQRAAFQPVQLVNQSWAAQVQFLQGVMAPGDLLFSASVHAEVANATSLLLQQISSVATCLYTRAGQALPIDRLGWAEFLRGVGLPIQMQSLAVLPNWNTQDYVSRQQMQMLVDWLFLQIDTTKPGAAAFMSDVVRVAILLASDAPVDNVIAGAVTLATTPEVGGMVHLTLPSIRVAHGMYVQLYSAGALAAQAVVTDLDTSRVRATVTQVYKSTALQPNDVAHFTAQPPETPALRAFDM